MPRSIAIALLGLLAATPGWGQSITPDSGSAPSEAWRIPHDSPLPHNLKFALPVSNYVAPDGSRSRQRGIIAGVEVAPETVVGIGFFDRQPRRSSLSPDPALDTTARRSRKAALGVSLKF